MHRLVFDPKNMNVRRERIHWGRILRNVLVFLALTFALFVFLYAIMALFFNTEYEKKLKKENRMYQKVLPSLEQRKIVLEDAIAHLQHKDNGIYEQVFHSTAPSLDPMGTSGEFYVSDSIPSGDINIYVSDKADDLLKRQEEIDSYFRRIAESLVERDGNLPPMLLPVKNISYTQVGASVGDKYNPFYNAVVRHNGIDLLASSGVEVFAPAAGEVIESKANTGAMGTVIRLRHAGGYETVYAHLGTRYVTKGQKVKAGQKIGTVGMTGNSFAPHLHYEMYLNGILADPVNYFFSSVSADEYMNMLYMASCTKQSMD